MSRSRRGVSASDTVSPGVYRLPFTDTRFAFSVSRGFPLTVERFAFTVERLTCRAEG